jgi:hypothetical protein
MNKVVYGGMGIKRIWKIFRFYSQIGEDVMNVLRIILYIITIFITVAVGVVVMDSAYNKQTVNGIYTQFMNIYNMIFIISIGLDNVKNTKVKKYNNNSNILLSCLPVSKKEIFTTRFILVQIMFLPVLLLEIFLILLNMKIGLNKDSCVCFGITVIIYCINNVSFNLSSGFSMLRSKKYNCFIFQKVILFIIFGFALIYYAYFSLSFVNKSNNIFSRINFGTQIFSPFSGIIGIFTIIISMIVSYYLGYVLPLKLSQGDE